MFRDCISGKMVTSHIYSFSLWDCFSSSLLLHHHLLVLFLVSVFDFVLVKFVVFTINLSFTRTYIGLNQFYSFFSFFTVMLISLPRYLIFTHYFLVTQPKTTLFLMTSSAHLIKSIAITGALGNLGTKLLRHLATVRGVERLIGLDIRPCPTDHAVQLLYGISTPLHCSSSNATSLIITTHAGVR